MIHGGGDVLLSEFCTLEDKLSAEHIDHAAFFTGGNNALTVQEASCVPPSSSSQPFTDGESVSWQVPFGAKDIHCVASACWTISASASFTSVISNAFVAAGKWMYEVTLLSDGQLQLGWSCLPAMIPWCAKLGVGDFPFTVAFDGSKQKICNVKAPVQSPVAKWLQGDVVSCMFDLDAGTVSYAQNGVPVGSISMPTHRSKGTRVSLDEVCMSYAPAISLGAYESCVVNLGGAPFSYPPSDASYRPIDTNQHTKMMQWLPKANLMLHAYRNSVSSGGCNIFAMLVNRVRTAGDNWSCFTFTLLKAIIMDIEAVGLEDPSQSIHRVESLVTLLSSILSAVDFVLVVEGLIGESAFRSSIRRLTTPTFNPYLQLIQHLTTMDVCRQILTSSNLFSAVFLHVFCVKAVSAHDLKVLFPVISLESDATPEGTTLLQNTLEYCDKVFKIDDQARKVFISTLLDSPDGNAAVHRSLEVCIKDIRQRPPRALAAAAVLPRHSSLVLDNSLACRIFFGIVGYLASKYTTMTENSESPNDVDQQLAKTFCSCWVLVGPSAAAAKFDLPRVGGLLPHLLRVCPVSQLEETQKTPFESSPDTLLVKAAMLYTSAVKEHVIGACGELLMRQRQRDVYINTDPSLTERKARAAADLSLTIRSSAWSLATLFRMDHKSLAKFCSLLCKIMNFYFSKPIFAYVPIVFVEVFVDVWHFARKTSPEYNQLVREHPENVMFFVERLLHSRIAHPDTSEYILLSLGGIIGIAEAQRQAVVHVLQSRQEQFRAALLLLCRQFGHPLAWTLVVGIFTKFNVGNSFCLADAEEEGEQWSLSFPLLLQESEPQSFEAYKFFESVFQQYLSSGGPQGRHLTSDPTVSPASFLKNLLAHCNWALSELGASLATVTEQLTTFSMEILAHRRRCSSIFELTRRLLHILEFTIHAGYSIFFDEPAAASDENDVQQQQSKSVKSLRADDRGQSKMNVAAVVEIWSQTLSRFSEKSNHVWRVSTLPGLQQGNERIKPWKLMASVIGVLHSMLRGGASLSPTSNPFLAELSKKGSTWTMEQVRFIFDEFDWVEISKKSCNVDKSSFTRNAAVREALQRAHDAVKRETRLEEDDSGVIEDGICSICAANAIDTSFNPCGHSSCNVCIRRHLQAHNKCFFCNAIIEDIKDMDAGTLPSPTSALV